MEEEVTYYSDHHGVQVTNARLVVGSKTYAMANIASVGTGVKSANRWWGIGIAALGFILLRLQPIVGLIVLALGGGFAVIAKPTYAVRIASTSGEVEALSSKDMDYVHSIVNAVNDAIVKRG